MTSPYERLLERKWRSALQLAAAMVVAAASVVALLDSAAMRAVSVLLIGVLALVGLKVSLVGFQRVARVERRATAQVAEPPTDSISADEVDGMKAMIAELRAEVATLATLTRRNEPALAEFATLRHEVTYLRETLSRLDRSNGSS